MVYQSTPLCEIIVRDPAIIPVIGRFGIRLGVGEQTTGQVAAAHGIDPGFFVTLLNAFLDEDYFPEKQLRAAEMRQIVDYLQKTNRHYKEWQLPNIERHLQAFIARSRVANDSLVMLGELFESFRSKLSAQIEYDEIAVFPALMAGEGVPVCDLSLDEQLADLPEEMTNLLVRYLTGEYDMNLCYAVIFALTSIQRDLAQHNSIRRRILHAPAGHKRRKTRKPDAASNQLTPREIEVLKWVVEGKTNREIADGLFISFHTVLTHRKNIAAKLGIHSVAGLTMYALMHGYN